MEILLYYLFVWVALCTLVACWHHGRGHEWHEGFLTSLFFSPLVGACVVLWHSIDYREIDKRLVKSGRLTRCPACREVISKQAVVCPHCRAQFKRKEREG